MQSQDEQVNEPQHYQFGTFQAIDVIEGVGRSIIDPVAAMLTGNLLKYAMRWPRKGGLRDLKKARWYLARLISHLDGVRVPPSPQYDPDAVRFRHGDHAKVCGIGDVPHDIKQHRVVVSKTSDLDELRVERSAQTLAEILLHAERVPKTGTDLPDTGTPSAAELAQAEGAGDYGNPTTPGCATPGRQSDTWFVSYQTPWQLP